MQLRGVSMAILGVGATVALLNMAIHPLARMSALTHDNSDLRAHQHRNRTRGVQRGHAVSLHQHNDTARRRHALDGAVACMSRLCKLCTVQAKARRQHRHRTDDLVLANAVRGSGRLVGDVAVLQQPDPVIDSMAAATGAAVAAMGAAESAAAQQDTEAAAVPAEAGESSSGLAAAAVANGVVTQQQDSSTDSERSAAGGEDGGAAKATDLVKDTAATQAGRHPLEQRVCGSPAIDG